MNILQGISSAVDEKGIKSETGKMKTPNQNRKKKKELKK